MHAQKGRLKKVAFRTLGGTVGGLWLMSGSVSSGDALRANGEGVSRRAFGIWMHESM